MLETVLKGDRNMKVLQDPLRGTVIIVFLVGVAKTIAWPYIRIVIEHIQGARLSYAQNDYYQVLGTVSILIGVPLVFVAICIVSWICGRSETSTTLDVRKSDSTVGLVDTSTVQRDPNVGDRRLIQDTSGTSRMYRFGKFIRKILLTCKRQR